MKQLKLLFLLLLLSAVIWLPFVLKMTLPGWGLDFTEGTKILWKNYDGPNYLVVAKTWYNKEQIGLQFSNPLPTEYYPAHFPLYPALISFFDFFAKGPTAMILTTLLGSVLCFGMFYKYISDFKLSKNYLWLASVFLFFPARWLAVRAVGSPEPWFIFFILASIYAFKKERFWQAGIWAFLAQLTKSPAIILLGAYGIFALVESWKHKKVMWKYLPLLVQVVAVFLLFWFYQIRTGDFWAYFNSGDNIHLFWPPFSIFSPQGQYWVGNFWLEDIIWIWLFFGLGILKLKKKKLEIEYYFAGLFFLSTLFVAHRDIARYILPATPFVLMGWDKLIQKKEFKIILAILVLPIVLYTWNFLLHNTAPIADWAPYL